MTAAFDETLAKASSHPDPAPGGSTRTDSVSRQKARRDMQEEDEAQAVSTILAGHRMAFHWLRSGDSECALMSCYVNGQPSALVVAGHITGNRVEIIPMFVALTKGMTVTDTDGDVIYKDGGVA